MTSFESWLKNRDMKLSEVLDQEHLQAHNFDALGAAQKKVQEDKEAKEKEESIKNLEFIKQHLENWVGHDEFGAEKLKWLGAVMHLQDPKGGKVNDSMESAIHHYKNTFKNLESLNSLFKKDNILSHMGNPKVLANLKKELERNWDEIEHDIHVDSSESEREHDHSHGELGKHFTEFVVSTILHVVDILIKGLKGELNNEPKIPVSQEEPKQVPSQMPEKQDAATAEPLGNSEGKPEAKQGMMGEVGKFMGFKS